MPLWDISQVIYITPSTQKLSERIKIKGYFLISEVRIIRLGFFILMEEYMSTTIDLIN